MKTSNINFEEVNIPLDNNLIEQLGQQFAVTPKDKPMFIIKASHQDEKMIMDPNEHCGFRMEPVTEIRTLVLSVFKISNGWIGTIDGHFACDYPNHTVTHITKLEFN